jgi:predicted glycogen debranching enzyme
MGYLDFDKEEVTNLNLSLKKEYIRTNRASAYACSTIINCNTRKYHGLLVCPIPELDGSNYVMLSALDEQIIQNDATFNLGIHKFPHEFNPLGHKYIVEFISDPTPTLIYRVGGVILKKEMLLVEEARQILIKYTLEQANSPTKLTLRPFLAFRKVEELTRANLTANTRCTKIENGISTNLYPNFPDLKLQTSTKSEFIVAPDWYLNFEYEKEKERGFDHQEDLLTPGYFEIKIKKGESVVFSASLEDVKTNSLSKKFNSELSKRIPRTTFENCLENSAHQFISRSKNKTEIIASFPWYGNWGRDSLIALPGLTLSIDDTKTCKEVLDTIIKDIDGLSYWNKGNIEHSNVESIDTPLWLFWTLQKYNETINSLESIKKDYGKKLSEIIKLFINNSNPDITLNENGLLYINTPDKALTWMDAEKNGKPIVVRWGYVVEINALWYNALNFMYEIENLSKTSKLKSTLKDLIDKINNSFENVFWSKHYGYLADYVTNDYQDFMVRPNQIFATALPYSPIDEIKQKLILDVISNELLTPKGIRSLSPKNANYKGECVGSKETRDYAYHQGSVWPWLLGFYSEAYLKIHQKTGLNKIKNIYEGLAPELKIAGLGTISEIYDGNPPHQPRGAISQAWSVAEVLRIRKMINSYTETIK